MNFQIVRVHRILRKADVVELSNSFLLNTFSSSSNMTECIHSPTDAKMLLTSLEDDIRCNYFYLFSLLYTYIN